MGILFGTLRLQMVRGATWTDTIAITDSLGVPVNLTGVTGITMRIRSTIDATTSLLELSIANGRIAIANAAGGIITLSVSASATLGLPVASHEIEQYVFDAVLDRGGSPQVIEPAFSGYVTVYPQVTRLLAEP